MNFLGWIDRRIEIYQEGARLHLTVIDQDAEGVVWVDNQGVNVGVKVVLGLGGSCEVLLANGAIGSLVTEDEMHLVVVTTLVGAEHDGVGRLSLKTFRLEVLRIREKLKIGAATGKGVGELDLVSSDEIDGRGMSVTTREGNGGSHWTTKGAEPPNTTCSGRRAEIAWSLEADLSTRPRVAFPGYLVGSSKSHFPNNKKKKKRTATNPTMRSREPLAAQKER